MISNTRRRILFVIPSLVGGGAERLLLYVLTHLNRCLFCPTLAVFNEAGVYVDQVPRDVKRFNLNKKGPLDFFRLIHQLSGIIRREQPDLIVAFLTYTNYLTLIARSYSGHKTPIVLTEHNTLSRSLSDERLKYIKKWIISQFYPKAEKIIAVSQGVKEDMIKNYGLPTHKIAVIYNSVDLEQLRALRREEVEHPWFESNGPVVVSAGRLTTQKNYSLLLRAISRLRDRSNVRLMLLGDGGQKTRLERKARELGIYDKVNFMGFQTNPFKYITKATMFVLSSSWEGFGNVLIEAMACGTPVISTRCPHGPDEIITDAVNGLLVPVGDVDAMAEAIARLLKDESLRKRLAEAGQKRAEDFRVGKMVAEYERVFIEVAARE